MGGISRSGSTARPGDYRWRAENSVPAGWLACNGAAVSRSAYAALFAAIGTAHGAGDGATTFNLPDMRGEFPRGFDDGRGVDSGRVFGSSQGDDFKSHTHAQQSTSIVNSAPTIYAGGSGSSWGEGGTTQATGGTETRPRNVAGLYVIKY